MPKQWSGTIEKAGPARWKIPRAYKPCMKSDGIIYASDKMIEEIRRDDSAEQVANVACLPGLVGHSMAMPDIHYGYGFPIGGVAATDVETGVVSPGGVGYDINCGVRLLRTDLDRARVEPRIAEIVNQVFRDVPSGVGSEGRIRVKGKELERSLAQGARWAVAQGYGLPEDLEHTESQGALEGADPSKLSDRALKRGTPQIGTLGAGNHFLEVQVVDTIYDERVARVMGIDRLDQITVMVHTGSRGLGYQVCDDYLAVMQKAMQKYGIEVPDRQLACAPVKSPEGQAYLAAMAAAANYAWANRQAIAHWVREAFERIFGAGAASLGFAQVYDVAHNVAKIEQHEVEGETRTLCVHRKGATRAFAPGRPEVPRAYREVGQPVLVPGDMGTHSYLLVGTEKAMRETWGSTCHGAGRRMSRHQAMRQAQGRDLAAELKSKGVYVRAASRGVLAEEMPEAYKNVDEVVAACEEAGISKPVVRLRPIGVMKG